MVFKVNITLIRVNINIFWLIISVIGGFEIKNISAKFVYCPHVSLVQMDFTLFGCAGINKSKNVYILPEQLCTRVMVMDFC